MRRTKKWTEPGSNRRHMDFQSIALPTELSVLMNRLIRRANIDVCQRPVLTRESKRPRPQRESFHSGTLDEGRLRAGQTG